MADGFSVDFSDLTKIAVQFDDVQDELPKGTTGAMRGALHTAKDVWQEGLEGSDVPASASTLWYRFSGNGTNLTGTLEPTLGSKRLRGYAKARELGSPTVTPGAHAAAAAAAAGDDLAKGLAIAGERAIERALGS